MLLSAVAGTPFDPLQTENHEDSRLSESASLVAMAEPPGVTDACIQTTDTAFALCAQCFETQHALVDSARLISGLCDRNKLKSKFASCNWDSLTKIGRLDVANWYEALQTDVAALNENSCLLLKSIKELNSEREGFEESSHRLQNKIQALEIQLNSQTVSTSVNYYC